MQGLKSNVSIGLFSRSPVDIIIPFHGQYDRVTRLVESILLATQSNPYQICLVDDCSPNKSFSTNLAKVPQMVVLKTPEQLGFAGALKWGYDRTEQPWVLFMHSDCHVRESNWLIELGRSLQRLKEQGIKMVSARTNNPGEGVSKTLVASAHDKSKDSILKEDEYLPLFCAMCHRDLFDRIGGFIRPYPYHWCADEELGYRMNACGLKQAVCGRSWIHHTGGATVKALWEANPEIKTIMEANYDLCLADMVKIKERQLTGARRQF